MQPASQYSFLSHGKAKISKFCQMKAKVEGKKPKKSCICTYYISPKYHSGDQFKTNQLKQVVFKTSICFYAYPNFLTYSKYPIRIS